MFINDWFGLVRVFVVGCLAYVILIVWLRITGKRALSKWNAFDFVVTIALGSTLASVIISRDVPLLEGAAALGLLVGLQFAITWLSVRIPALRKLIKAEPTLLLDNGKFLDEVMLRERVSESEVRMAIRSKGAAAIEEIEAVVLETDGSFSVIKKSKTDSRSALEDVSSSSNEHNLSD
jgi:uncharacterized membrane protein YcaP (DUF421 family)